MLPVAFHRTLIMLHLELKTHGDTQSRLFDRTTLILQLDASIRNCIFCVELQTKQPR